MSDDAIAIRNALKAVRHDVNEVLDQVIPGPLLPFLEELNGFRPIFLTGQGRTGIVLQAWAQRLMQADLTVHVVGLPTTPAITEQATLIACSGSGATQTTITYMTQAKAVGARIGLITGEEESQMTTLADFYAIVPQASHTQPLRSQFEQGLLLVLDALVLALMAKRGISADDLTRRHSNLQ